MAELKRYGLIGFPVKHSLSAAMHNAAFKHLNIAARYELFEIKPEGLEAEFKKLIAEGVSGFNVTIPHKEKIIKLINSLTVEAQVIGAVNTLEVAANAEVTGYNTDGPGFISHLKEEVKLDLNGRNVALLGAGGAARAIGVALLSENVASLKIFDIDSDKAKNLAQHLKDQFSLKEIKVANEADALLDATVSLLVNATPVGMEGKGEFKFNPDLFHHELYVYDLVYNPQETALLKTAKEKKCAGAISGLGMLLHQGALAFKIWTGQEAPLDVMRKAVEGEIK